MKTAWNFNIMSKKLKAGKIWNNNKSSNSSSSKNL